MEIVNKGNLPEGKKNTLQISFCLILFKFSFFLYHTVLTLSKIMWFDLYPWGQDPKFTSLIKHHRITFYFH